MSDWIVITITPRMRELEIEAAIARAFRAGRSSPRHADTELDVRPRL